MQTTRLRQNLKCAALAVSAAGTGRAAHAHASEQGFVLLLPTDLYTGAGVAAVALTVVALGLLPARMFHALGRSAPILPGPPAGLKQVTSLLSLFLLTLLVWAGLEGPRDPLANPMPLMIWTLFWIGFVGVQGLIGDLWSWINPWTGLLNLLRRLDKGRRYAALPTALGYWLGVLSFLGFAYVLLADPAPADPARLARYVAAYWLFTFVMALIHGPRWMRRAEGIGMMLRAYARLGLFARRKGRLRLGPPGWQTLHGRPMPLGLATLTIVLLGTGSFDGINETFWWLGLNGINPLEFPGRSAVVTQSTIGLIIANAALIAVFAATLWLGSKIAQDPTPLSLTFRRFAPSILPIALGYHVAHYLPSFLVDSQYALVALSDPFLTGADHLGLGEFYVSTGFFNTQDSVRRIYLAQAGAVVAGHVLAVILAHAIAIRALGTTRRAVLSQFPLALFMIAYTLLGLWLLSSPRF